MKRLSGYIFKMILVMYLSITCAHAQVDQDSLSGSGPLVTEPLNQKKTEETLPDTIMLPVKVPVIRRLEISLDYLKLVSFVLPSETKVEGGLAIITKPNIGISFEFGYAAKMPEEHFKNAEYQVEGYYRRVGLSYHFPLK